MATSEGIPSSIDIELLELNDNPYFSQAALWGGKNPREAVCDFFYSLFEGI